VEPYFLEWANLLLRWLHVITAIAWIGSSFYFVFLDSNLLEPTAPDLKAKGVTGAMWAVHGGGFYNPQKYMTAPANIDSKLHWFYWESYSTWLSGFALFTVLYLYNAGTFLIDKSLMNWSAGAAISCALAFLIVFWLVYDWVCRWVGFKDKGELIIGLVMLATVALMCWLVCQLFAGRAAFLLVGAAIATAMSANVLFWIIPGQRKVVAAMTSGQPYNLADLAIHGKRGKQRSVHNTYFTLPVIFAMLSNHYSFLYTSHHNWLVLFAMMSGGALIRQFFVQKHGWHHGRAKHPWPWAASGSVVLLAVILALRPSAKTEIKTAGTVPFKQVQSIIEQRCYQCHNAQVQMKNVALHTPALIAQHAQNIYQQVVVAKQMPMNNATQITDQERASIETWFLAGASVGQ
jgi:uncharacterized membrane protein